MYTFRLLKILVHLGFILFFLFAFYNVSYAASFSLSPNSKSVSVNQQFDLSVILDTQSADTDGADAIITYDPAYLSVVSAKLGSLYDTPVTTNTSTSGKITLSAIASGDTTYASSGTFAALTFLSLQNGTTNVDFTFTSGSTTDSNVTSNQTDVLTSVASSTITIGSGVGGEPYTAPTSGSVELTLGILTLAIIAWGSAWFLKSKTY